MIKTAKVKWIEDFRLEGLTDNNLEVKMDSGPKAVAAFPAQLFLQALAGCTMMYCVLIIHRSRKKLLKFWIDVEAEEAEEHPKIFTKIHMTYNFIGADLDTALIERAMPMGRGWTPRSRTGTCLGNFWYEQNAAITNLSRCLITPHSSFSEAPYPLPNTAWSNKVCDCIRYRQPSLPRVRPHSASILPICGWHWL